MKAIKPVISLIALSLCASMASAKPLGIDKRLEKMTQRLDLTETQQQEIRAVMEAGKARRQQLLASYGVDESVREQLRGIHRDSREQVKSLLTAKQRKKIEVLKTLRDVEHTY